MNSCQRKINPSIEGSSSAVSQSKTRGARKTINSIVTNTVGASTKYGVFLYFSLLVFANILIITNKLLSLGMAP